MAKMVYGYSRVSTQRQANQGTSLEAQEAQIKKYCEVMLEPKGYEWAGLFRDAAWSGKKHLLQRPSGRDLSMKLEPDDAVVFSRLDRGFRNLKDLLTTLDIWHARRVSVHLLDLHCDTSTPIGRLIVSVLGSVAEFECAWRVERVRLVVDDLRARGYFVGPGLPPYGWKVLGRRGRKKLYIDKAQRAIGAKILEWRKTGWTVNQIFWHLFKTGVRHNGKEIGPGHITKWIKWELHYQAQEARGEPLTVLNNAGGLVQPKKPAAASPAAAPKSHTG